jgi:predicted nucleotide-binding protein (sugar kinase/HSP70/actin superfamily)
MSGLRIGMPRALHFHYHPQLWEVFFESLGAEPVQSPTTNRRIIELASTISEAEHCLPVKLLDAHVATLVDDVDAVFVPRYLSTLPGHFSCAKFGALPDAVKVQFRGRTKVLTVDLDMDAKPLPEILTDFGRALGCDKRLVEAAVRNALRTMEQTSPAAPEHDSADLPVILLAAHPYILHDDYFLAPIISILEELQVTPRFLAVTAEGVADSFIKWDSCNKMYHAVRSLTPREVAGVIQICSFNCGCDSMTVEFFREALQEKSIPFMMIMLDEHTAQGGIETRLEAFVDSMRF